MQCWNKESGNRLHIHDFQLWRCIRRHFRAYLASRSNISNLMGIPVSPAGTKTIWYFSRSLFSFCLSGIKSLQRFSRASSVSSAESKAIQRTGSLILGCDSFSYQDASKCISRSAPEARLLYFQMSPTAN